MGLGPAVKEVNLDWRARFLSTPSSLSTLAHPPCAWVDESNLQYTGCGTISNTEPMSPSSPWAFSTSGANHPPGACYPSFVNELAQSGSGDLAGTYFVVLIPLLMTITKVHFSP